MGLIQTKLLFIPIESMPTLCFALWSLFLMCLTVYLYKHLCPLGCSRKIKLWKTLFYQLGNHVSIWNKAKSKISEFYLKKWPIAAHFSKWFIWQSKANEILPKKYPSRIFNLFFSNYRGILEQSVWKQTPHNKGVVWGVCFLTFCPKMHRKRVQGVLKNGKGHKIG